MSKLTIVAKVALGVGILVFAYGIYMDRTTPGLGGIGYAVLSALAFIGIIVPASFVLFVQFMKNRKSK